MPTQNIPTKYILGWSHWTESVVGGSLVSEAPSKRSAWQQQILSAGHSPFCGAFDMCGKPPEFIQKSLNLPPSEVDALYFEETQV